MRGLFVLRLVAGLIDIWLWLLRWLWPLRSRRPPRAPLRSSPSSSSYSASRSRSAMSEDGESERRRAAFERDARLCGTQRRRCAFPLAPPFALPPPLEPFSPAADRPEPEPEPEAPLPLPPPPSTYVRPKSCTSTTTGVSKPTRNGWGACERPPGPPILSRAAGGTETPCVRRCRRAFERTANVLLHSCSGHLKAG